MTTKELAIATSTIWVVLAAVLVMFMQAGFAFLEAGLTRMKNVGHIAAKNVLVLALASVVYYLVGFGIAFGDGGNGLWGGSGFVPSVDELLAVGSAPFSWFAAIPAAAGYLFEVVFAAVSLAIVWGAMAERTRLWVYFAFGAVFTLIYSLVSHWIWSPDGWLFAKGMQDFAGSTVVHYQGALAGLAGRDPARPEDRQVRRGQAAERDSGAQHGVHDARRDHPLVRLVRLQRGFHALGRLRGRRLLRLRRPEHESRGGPGVLGAVFTSWLVIKKPDLSMMLNGAIAALVAITAACAFVAPWGAILIGFVAGVIVVFGILLVERIGLDDPVGAIAAHGMSGVWGTLALGFLTVPSLAERSDREAAASSTGAGCTSSASRRSASRPWAHSRSARRSSSSLPSRRRSGSAPSAEDEAGRPGHLRARHVGLPRVLHSGARRLWNG